MLYHDYFICLLMYLNLSVTCTNMDRKKWRCCCLCNQWGKLIFLLKVIVFFFSWKYVLISLKCKDSKEAALKKNLAPADEVHCILYVISAKANLTTKISKSMKIMKSVLQRIQKDGNFFLNSQDILFFIC